MLRIAWPLVIANSFWNLQLTIDRIFLGQYSTESLGAAMSVFGVFWAPMALVQQTAAYVTVFVAQYYGANRRERIGPAVWHSIYLAGIGGLLFLLLIPVTPWMFEQFDHPPQTQRLEIQYFHALCHSALPTALVAAASGFFTGLGQSRTIMGINGVGLLVNAALDYLMIFGNWGFPAMGIAGAGYATALANWAGALFGFWLVFSRANQRTYRVRSGWRLDRGLMARFIRFGVPSGLQWALEGLAFTVFLIFVGRMPHGEAALAASGITVTVMMLSVLPALGVAQAVSVLVGQHLGENRPQLAEAVSWHGLQIAIAYMVCVSLTFVIAPGFYLSWFHNAENARLWADVSRMVPYLLMFVAVFTLFDSMNMVLSFALKGAGDTRFVTMVALTVPWPLMVLPTWWVSSMDSGIYWAWAAASVYVVFQALVFLRRFQGGKWKEMRVIES